MTPNHDDIYADGVRALGAPDGAGWQDAERTAASLVQMSLDHQGPSSLTSHGIVLRTATTLAIMQSSAPGKTAAGLLRLAARVRWDGDAEGAADLERGLVWWLGHALARATPFHDEEVATFVRESEGDDVALWAPLITTNALHAEEFPALSFLRDALGSLSPDESSSACGRVLKALQIESPSFTAEWRVALLGEVFVRPDAPVPTRPPVAVEARPEATGAGSLPRRLDLRRAGRMAAPAIALAFALLVVIWRWPDEPPSRSPSTWTWHQPPHLAWAAVAHPIGVRRLEDGSLLFRYRNQRLHARTGESVGIVVVEQPGVSTETRLVRVAMQDVNSIQLTDDGEWTVRVVSPSSLTTRVEGGAHDEHGRAMDSVTLRQPSRNEAPGVFRLRQTNVASRRGMTFVEGAYARRVGPSTHLGHMNWRTGRFFAAPASQFLSQPLSAQPAFPTPVAEAAPGLWLAPIGRSDGLDTHGVLRMIDNGTRQMLGKLLAIQCGPRVCWLIQVQERDGLGNTTGGEPDDCRHLMFAGFDSPGRLIGVTDRRSHPSELDAGGVRRCREQLGSWVSPDDLAHYRSFTETAPGPPQGLSVAYQASTARNRITWALSDGATSYTVYWGTSPGVTTGSNVMPSTSTTDYGHSGVITGQQYCYRVRANNTWGSSGLSAEQCVTVPTRPAPQ